MQTNTQMEKDDQQSTRGLDDHWEDFSDSEDELEALKLITEAEEELMKEYENNNNPIKVMEPPSTRGIDEADEDNSSQEEQRDWKSEE